MIKQCANCTQDFKVKPSHYHQYFCCSAKCSWEKRRREFKSITEKKCKDCKQVFPLSFFNKKLNIVVSRCNNCQSIFRKDYYKKHIERFRSNGREQYKNNPGPAIKSATAWNKSHPAERSKIMVFQNRKRKSRMRAKTGIELTASIWKEVKNFFDNKCAYCGAGGNMSMEHFIPISKGGFHCVSNILPACKNCNSSKSNQEPHEWVTKHFGKEVLGKVLRYTQLNYQQFLSDINKLL